jgi:CBS domain-containing protein
VSFDDLLRDMARTLGHVPDSTAAEAREAYLRACRRLDENPAEQQRIDDIAGLLDAEETLYTQARAAADRGDTVTAIPLLRKCAEAGTGEAAWLLAQLLEETGDTAEAVIWYQHARDDGDDRAGEKLAALRARPCPHAILAGSPRDDRAAAASQSTLKIFVSHPSGQRLWPGLEGRPGAAAAGAAYRAASTCSGLRDLDLAAWIDIPASGFGHASCDGLSSRSIPPELIFSDARSDRFASLAKILRVLTETGDCLACDISRARTRSATKPARMLMYYKVTCACESYDRPHPANLGRYLAATSRWQPRWLAREPVVADVMLPSSEVPACSPDTTVAQALELLVQSGTQALPVCETTRVTGIVTLADLARHISGHQGLPSAAETIRTLMRPAIIVPPGTPLPAIAKAIADDGIIVVSVSGDQPDGYLTSESLLTQAPPGTSARPASPGRPPLLMPGTGAVLLDRR